MRKLLYALVIGVLMPGLFGCGTAPEVKTPPESGGLAEWAGTWNNFYSYFERPALNQAYEVLAKKEGKTAEEVKRRYLEGLTYQCDIAALDIAGSTVSFYSTAQTTAHSGSGAAYRAVYSGRGEVDINGRKWRYFETSADIPYKHLLLLPAEADIPGKTMVHFHFRYGKDLETIKNAEGWYATMIAYDSSDDLIVGHMTN